MNLKEKDKITEFVGWLIGYFVVVPIIFMLIWNAIIPNISQLPEIGFWYSLGIIVMAKLCQKSSER